MTNAIQEWVVYHPPKSAAFGHHSTPRDPRKAWPLLERFLAGLDGVELGHFVELTCYEGGKWTDTAVAERRINDARLSFGPILNPTSPHPRWKISETQLPTAIQFALDDDKFPKQQWGPVSLSFYYKFLWPEFERRPYWVAEAEKRPRQSSLSVSMGARKLFLQPIFVFPAPWNSKFLRDYISRLEQMVPFRFRDQYFKRWVPAKKAGFGRMLKLPASWRDSHTSTD